MDDFITAFRADVVTILHLSDPSKVTDIVATEGRAALLSLSSSELLADEIQHVDVKFTLQPGASNAVAPVQLAALFEYALGNNTAEFTQTQNVSGISVNATFKGTSVSAINLNSPGGIILLIFIILLPLCCCCALAYAVHKYKRASNDKPAEDNSDFSMNPLATGVSDLPTEPLDFRNIPSKAPPVAKSGQPIPPRQPHSSRPPSLPGQQALCSECGSAFESKDKFCTDCGSTAVGLADPVAQ